MKPEKSCWARTSRLLWDVRDRTWVVPCTSGYSKLTPSTLSTAKHTKNHDDYLRRYRETGKTSIIGSMREVRGRKKNGEEIPVVLGIERIEAEGSDEPLLVAFVRDITEQKKATEMEIEIRAAEELLLNMLPEEIANRLKLDPHHLADHHEKATILFADIVGYDI